MPIITCPVILYEEEIRSGGMGMNLYDKLVNLDIMKNKNIQIMAVDDSFVTDRKKGEAIYTSAKIDADSVCQKISELIK